MLDGETAFDAIVVGAGFGGLYANHRLREIGLSVLGLESAGGVGGVWYHNRYPGARVDVESCEYCYHFSEALYREWEWSERYAAQPELLRYLNHVADRFDIRRHIRFDTRMTGARWDPAIGRYHVETSTGGRFTCRFLIMATGNLTVSRKPDFPGLDDFRGEWVQTANWPHRDVPLKGRRVAVIGTGSSGVQVVTAVAEQAERLTVFQRSANYSVPAHNGPIDPEKVAAIKADVASKRAELLATSAGLTSGLPPVLPYADYPEEERALRMERQWAVGGHGMNRIFADQGTNIAVNEIVAAFARGKIREIVQDPAVADMLCPTPDLPFGSRRTVVDTGYYQTFNRPNVTLVDVEADPIERITETGIQTATGHHPVDLIIFSLGFDAFRGALDQANISNEHGATVTSRWDRGPRTLLGLMTSGFPNLFILTGPGSPSVASNVVLSNEEHVNYAAGIIAHMREGGFDTVEPSIEAEDAWCAVVEEAGSRALRLNVDRKLLSWLVHDNEDGSRVFIPYAGGVAAFAQISRDVAQKGYEGFAFATIDAG